VDANQERERQTWGRVFAWSWKPHFYLRRYQNVGLPVGRWNSRHRSWKEAHQNRNLTHHLLWPKYSSIEELSPSLYWLLRSKRDWADENLPSWPLGWGLGRMPTEEAETIRKRGLRRKCSRGYHFWYKKV